MYRVAQVIMLYTREYTRKITHKTGNGLSGHCWRCEIDGYFIHWLRCAGSVCVCVVAEWCRTHQTTTMSHFAGKTATATNWKFTSQCDTNVWSMCVRQRERGAEWNGEIRRKRVQQHPEWMKMQQLINCTYLILLNGAAATVFGFDQLGAGAHWWFIETEPSVVGTWTGRSSDHHGKSRRKNHMKHTSSQSSKSCPFSSFASESHIVESSREQKYISRNDRFVIQLERDNVVSIKSTEIENIFRLKIPSSECRLRRPFRSADSIF